MRHLDIFLTALKLGLTSFGGPIAHLAYFRNEYVQKKRWISEESYAEVVALCQFLPGPASSQVGMAIGYFRGGVLGSLLAWIGFTLPSALILTLFALKLGEINISEQQNWIHGLKVAAVSVVAHAVWGMWKSHCSDLRRALIALVSALILLAHQTALTQVGVLLSSVVLGLFFLPKKEKLAEDFQSKGGRSQSVICLTLFTLLLLTLPLFSSQTDQPGLQRFDSFYRSGALVFGGGHVVLPLLQSEVVGPQMISNDLFMAGYGLSNAIPGPLFVFSAYLGAAYESPPNGLLGAGLCLIAIFLPSYLLILGVLPIWNRVRQVPRMGQVVQGLNASVVGILLAALYRPVWTSAVYSAEDAVCAGVGFMLLKWGRLPSWAWVVAMVLYYWIRD